MSFLSPATSLPKLGIDLSALLRISALQSTAIEPNISWAVRTAESAGADTLILSISAADHLDLAQRQNVESVKNALIDLQLSSQLDSQLNITLSAEMIDLVGTLRPASVCFQIGAIDFENENSRPDPGALFPLMQRAVARLEALSIQVIFSIGVDSAPLHLLRNAGVTAVEFDTRSFTQAQPAEKTAALNALYEAVLGAKKLGMEVHLGHGIDYCHLDQLARLGDVTQINIGYAIVARSLVVGLQTAINEMKALLVTCYAPARNRLGADTVE